MKSAKVITLLAVSALLVAMNATATHAKNIRWRDMKCDLPCIRIHLDGSSERGPP
jgi:hypothetical protein